MRLLPEHIAVIKLASAEVIGAEASVRLFGSRLDDQARGGDIDLLVEAPGTLPNRSMAAARLAALIERRLGGRRVDVVLVDANTPLAPVHAVAKAQGVLL
jgi:predicted nucleotidyltransferase